MLYVRGSKLTSLCVRAENSFLVSVSIDLVFVRVIGIDLNSVWGMELDLISV